MYALHGICNQNRRSAHCYTQAPLTRRTQSRPARRGQLERCSAVASDKERGSPLLQRCWRQQLSLHNRPPEGTTYAHAISLAPSPSLPPFLPPSLSLSLSFSLCLPSRTHTSTHMHTCTHSHALAHAHAHAHRHFIVHLRFKISPSLISWWQANSHAWDQLHIHTDGESKAILRVQTIAEDSSGAERPYFFRTDSDATAKVNLGRFL